MKKFVVFFMLFDPGGYAMLNIWTESNVTRKDIILDGANKDGLSYVVQSRRDCSTNQTMCSYTNILSFFISAFCSCP